MKKKKNELSGLFWYILIGCSFVLMILIAVGFALFSNRPDEVIEQEENGGFVVLNYSSQFPGLTITDALPMSDEFGMVSAVEGEYLDFSVSTSLEDAPSIEYEVSILKDSVLSTIPDDAIRIYLEKEERGSYTKVMDPVPYEGISKETSLGSEKGSMVLYKIKKTKSTSDNYRLRIWLSDTSLLVTGNYSVKVIINGESK